MNANGDTLYAVRYFTGGVGVFMGAYLLSLAWRGKSCPGWYLWYAGIAGVAAGALNLYQVRTEEQGQSMQPAFWQQTQQVPRGALPTAQVAR